MVQNGMNLLYYLTRIVFGPKTLAQKHLRIYKIIFKIIFLSRLVLTGDMCRVGLSWSTTRKLKNRDGNLETEFFPSLFRHGKRIILISLVIYVSINLYNLDIFIID